MAFITTVTGTAGQPLHITLYDGQGDALNPATSPATWTGLPTTPVAVTVSSDSTGYVFSASAAVSAFQARATISSPPSSGTLTMTFQNAPLQFTSP